MDFTKISCYNYSEDSDSHVSLPNGKQNHSDFGNLILGGFKQTCWICILFISTYIIHINKSIHNRSLGDTHVNNVKLWEILLCAST